MEAIKPLRKKLGYNVTPISVEQVEALADEVTVLRDDIFTVGWNATAANGGHRSDPAAEAR